MSTCKSTLLSVLLGVLAACSNTPGTQAATAVSNGDATPGPTKAGDAPTSVNAKAFCAKLQPAVQPLVKAPLSLFKADDSTTDQMHAGESQYADCDFRQQNTQIDVSLHDDSGHDLFDDPNEKGYAPLSGFGDKARYSVKGAMGMRWVDVVRGSVACEARLTADGDQINGDWKQAAGKMCDAAFAMRQS